MLLRSILFCQSLDNECHVQDALQPAQSAAQEAIQRLARLVSQQPDLQFPITSDKAQAWLINTFLDEVCSLPSTLNIGSHAQPRRIYARAMLRLDEAHMGCRPVLGEALGLLMCEREIVQFHVAVRDGLSVSYAWFCLYHRPSDL